jgi:tetratricopeptide (TPR) repeat protein
MSEPNAPQQSPSTIRKLAEWAAAQEAAERELAEQDAAAARAAAAGASAAPSPAPAPVHTPRRAGPLRRLIGALALLALAVGPPVASAAYFWLKPKPPAEEAEKPKPAQVVPALPADAIDPLISAGSFGEALAACRRPGPELPPAQKRKRAYREAVCLEALGRLKEADEHYRKAEPPDGDRGAWARSLLGRARCALAADDLATAEQLLNQVALRSGHPDCSGAHVAEECAFLRARLATAKLGAVRAMDPFDPDAVAWPGLGGAADAYFDWLPPDTAPAASAGLPGGPSAFEVRLAEGGGREVTAHAAERPVGDALRAIAAAAGLKLQADEAAAAALAKTVTALDVNAMPLPELLSALLGSAGLGWKLQDGTLYATAAGSPGPDAAEAAVKRALAVAPTHPRAMALKVWMANFDAAAGRTTDAAKRYQELLDARQPQPEAAHAAYNLGLLELKAGALRSARSRFIDLVDRAPRTKWFEYGWWWAGRVDLDAGDTAAARRAFRSAVGKNREVASAVALATCACALLDGDDAAAREALDGVRVAPRERHMALGEAFDMLLRYRGAPTDGRKADLLKALRGCDEGQALGPVGGYLVGRVYRDLALPDRMAALYDRTAADARGPLAVRMLFDAGTWYDLSDRPERARARYQAIAAADPTGLGPLSELRLAAMSLRAGAADDCVRRCRKLVGRAGVDPSDVLSLMGRGYEAKRNYRSAAECFAGRVPKE